MASSLNVMVLGAGGQLGSELCKTVPGHVNLRALRSLDVDIRNNDALASAMQNFAPHVIINAAAYTQVDRAESEPQLADAINHLGVRNIIEASALLHVGDSQENSQEFSLPRRPGESRDPAHEAAHSLDPGFRRDDDTQGFRGDDDTQGFRGDDDTQGLRQSDESPGFRGDNADAGKADSQRTRPRIIHISTDFVFDGTASAPYQPGDHTNPLSVYGRSKLAGEQALLALAADRSCIIRTAWLYGAEGKNFVNTMLSLMTTRDALSVVDDQHGTPTSVASLARAIWHFADRPNLHGLFHWTDAGAATWYQFACEIQAQALRHGLLTRKIPIHPVATSAYPTPATRPRYSVLDKTTTWQAAGISATPWQEELNEVIAAKAEMPR